MALDITTTEELPTIVVPVLVVVPMVVKFTSRFVSIMKLRIKIKKLEEICKNHNAYILQWNNYQKNDNKNKKKIWKLLRIRF